MDFFNDIFSEIIKILGFILAGAAGYFIPKLSSEVKRIIQQKYFNISLKKSVEIKVKLAEVKASLSANRIYLFQFHNGRVYLGDKSFHKYAMSAIFEVSNHGLSREIQNYQSVPLSKFAELIQYLIESEKDYAVVGDGKNCDMSFDDADWNEMKYSLGTSGENLTMVVVEVRNEKKQFIGIISILFDRQFTEKDLLDLRSKSGLNGLLIELQRVMK
jgi:hypothetical protein